MTGGALEGLKVLDVSRFVAGPFCAMMLGDLGAEVVKVEKPGTGEDIRRVPPRLGGDSLFVMAFNRNKRSLTLDLRHPRGQEVLRALATRADILVENFRPGVMEAMGCGWDVLSALNEWLIMARISGYGQDGPYADRPTFDAIAQAASGMMEMTGAADGPPTMAGTTVIDHTTGLHATVGVLAALEAEGVEYIFAVPCEENLDLPESLRTSSIQLVVSRHEQGAGCIAATYGRLTGKAGLCLPTLGPCATNLTTPSATAAPGARAPAGSNASMAWRFAESISRPPPFPRGRAASARPSSCSAWDGSAATGPSSPRRSSSTSSSERRWPRPASPA